MDDIFTDERWTEFGLFVEAHNAVMAANDAELTDDLDRDAGGVLIQLVRSPDEQLRMIDLARSAALTPSRVTRLVDRLVKDGLVERRACETDRRAIWAKLTPEGRALIERSAPNLLASFERNYFGHLSSSERAVLRKVMRRLRDEAQAARCPPPEIAARAVASAPQADAP